MKWDGMVDHGGEGRGKIVRRDMGRWKVLWVVLWNMCGVEGGGYVVGDLGGREGSGRGWGYGMSWLSGWKVSGVGGGDGCLLGGGKGVRGGVVFAFFLRGLEGWGPCDLKGIFGLSLQGRINLNLSPKARVLLSQRLHLVSTALLQICQLLLHLCLAVQDGG